LGVEIAWIVSDFLTHPREAFEDWWAAANSTAQGPARRSSTQPN
jgi:hypothetical protein